MKEIILTRKIKLFPMGNKEEIDRVYTYIRNGQYSQNKATNILLSHIFSAIYAGATNEEINEIYKLSRRNSDSKLGSLYKDIEFPKGLGIAGDISQVIVKPMIKKAQQDGLFKGRISLPNVKLDSPLCCANKFLTFYHELENDDNLETEIYKEDFKLYLKFVNGIVFEVILGRNLKKSRTIRSELLKVLKGEYKVCDSSMQIDGKSIMLNLAMKIPFEENVTLDENTIVGVDLGIAIPAVCSLNNSKYQREYIGSKDEFLRVRTQIQAQKRQHYRNLNYIKGGHGRKKKLKSLDRFSDYESNFTKTYNHYVSKQIIDFALKNKAKYIHIENLTKEGFDDRILRNWSYYQLQQFISYKAEKYGIVVKKVNPYHTSQICSECGHWEEGQRVSQSEFECKSCGTKLNADYNASRNIAMSTDFIICDNDKTA